MQVIGNQLLTSDQQLDISNPVEGALNPGIATDVAQSWISLIPKTELQEPSFFETKDN